MYFCVLASYTCCTNEKNLSVRTAQNMKKSEMFLTLKVHKILFKVFRKFAMPSLNGDIRIAVP